MDKEEAMALIQKKISKLSKQRDHRRRRAKPRGTLDSNDIERIQKELRGKLDFFLDAEAKDRPAAVSDISEDKVDQQLPEYYRQVVERFNAKASRYYERNEEQAEDGEEENGLDEMKNEDLNRPLATEPHGQSGDVVLSARTKESRKPTRRQQKELLKKQLAQLKVMVERPDLVESWDVTAPDPILLIHLKSYKNTVEVPRHWSQKKKFLQTKRGAFKRAFRLPAFIEATGIAKLRDPLSEISSLKMIRQKIKERMNPRLGKIDIDYQTLHDAFFKFQTKPRMTLFGDIYYEGKEEDQRMRTYRPGRLSPELRVALGISESAPAPWLLNMHKFGPPPAYPNLKLSGLGLDAFKLIDPRRSDGKKEDELVEWAWEDQGYVFGALKEDKIDDEELGYQLQNDYEEEVAGADVIQNEENPYFRLDVFQADT